ncbi:hypothetical protein [Lactococcus petauri]|nr:hypothetical protein [Lactococcus petauri]
MAYNLLAQHSTAQHSTAQHSSNFLLFFCLQSDVLRTQDVFDFLRGME